MQCLCLSHQVISICRTIWTWVRQAGRQAGRQPGGSQDWLSKNWRRAGNSPSQLIIESMCIPIPCSRRCTVKALFIEWRTLEWLETFGYIRLWKNTFQICWTRALLFNQRISIHWTRTLEYSTVNKKSTHCFNNFYWECVYSIIYCDVPGSPCLSKTCKTGPVYCPFLFLKFWVVLLA